MRCCCCLRLWFWQFFTFYLFSFSFPALYPLCATRSRFRLTYDLVACYNCFSCAAWSSRGTHLLVAIVVIIIVAALRCNFLEICAHFGISFSCALLWVSSDPGRVENETETEVWPGLVEVLRPACGHGSVWHCLWSHKLNLFLGLDLASLCLCLSLSRCLAVSGV